MQQDEEERIESLQTQSRFHERVEERILRFANGRERPLLRVDLTERHARAQSDSEPHNEVREEDGAFTGGFTGSERHLALARKTARNHRHRDQVVLRSARRAQPRDGKRRVRAEERILLAVRCGSLTTLTDDNEIAPARPVQKGWQHARKTLLAGQELRHERRLFENGHRSYKESAFLVEISRIVERSALRH